ncbi:MAG: hypothetical protein V7K24_24110, partial [Nostoc sp.]
KGDKGDNEVMEFSSITVPIFDICREQKPQFKTETIQVIKGTENEALLNFQQIAAIKGQVCTPIEAIAGVPDWWQIRIEGKVPQVSFHCGEDLGNNKVGKGMFVITIPHTIAILRWTTPPIQNYTKGNSEGILILNDNSKLIVNCIDENECNRVINEISIVIDPNFLSGSFLKIGNRRGIPVLNRKVLPRYAKYFSTGLRNVNPDWTAYFN